MSLSSMEALTRLSAGQASTALLPDLMLQKEAQAAALPSHRNTIAQVQNPQRSKGKDQESTWERRWSRRCQCTTGKGKTGTLRGPRR